MAIGVLLALLAGVFRYTDQHFHTADTFIKNTTSLRDNADVRERIFAGFRTEIIRLADGDAIDEIDEPIDLGSIGNDDISEVLDPVTDARIERDQAIESILIETLDSDLYNEAFVDALKVTQTQIVRSAELEEADLLRDSGQITFDLRRLYPSIYQRLAADDKTAFITESPLPEEFGVFAIADRETTINLVWTGIRSGPGWRTITYVGAVFALIGAVFVAERRPSTAIQFGGGMAGTAAVVLVIIYILRALVPLLADGGSSGGSVVAVYATTIWPLVRMMIWMLVLGGLLTLGGWVARLIWPDDWVYSHVSDDRGIRSIKRRRGEPEPEPAQAAAAYPVQYPGYAQPPYVGYPPGWGQPYPGQPYMPPGAYPYPVGPYAQPSIPTTPYTPGQPTVPVLPVSAETGDDDVVKGTAVIDSGEVAGLPEDAARVVPQVVTSTDNGTEPGVEPDSGSADADDWSAEPDW